MDNLKISAEAAQTLGLEALTWLLGQEDLIGVFLNSTGTYPQDLAQLASQPLFLAAVLDFLMESDERVVNFCTAHGQPLTSVQAARAALPGAQHRHWT